MVAKVYCFIIRPPKNGIIDCVALGSCGHILTNHTSSDINLAKHDMGVTSTIHHAEYARHFPQGFEVVWVDNPHEHPGFNDAIKRNEMLVAKETSPKLH